jgi:UDP-N-acetylglucosamine acyltransferase
VGRAVMVAAGTKTPKDITPFAMVGGEPPRFVGMNRVGLKRIGLSEEDKTALRHAYRLIFGKSIRLEEGLKKAEEELGKNPQVAYLVKFIKESERGILRD